jgi:hypothetical protein
VGARFYSTEKATLPFLVKGTEGRYFICYIYQQDQMHTADFPFIEGDEILTFDGRPIGEVIEELQKQLLGNNVAETDRAMAEMILTKREGKEGHPVPRGSVCITGRPKGSSEILSAYLTWHYVPEKIRDFSHLGAEAELIPEIQTLVQKKDVKDILHSVKFFEKWMIPAFWDISEAKQSREAHRYSVGARTTFTPILGKAVLWRSSMSTAFDAYIFLTAEGHRIGYVRLPHYAGDLEEVEEFGMLMNYFQKRTEGLVIDQVNNPGGSVFYLYALASTLAHKPLYVPKHRIALTQQDIYTANELLSHLQHVNDDATAQAVIGTHVGGYPVDYRFARTMENFCHFLIGQWNVGKIFSAPIYLFGVDEIQPHPQYRYTKPILLLVNSLDFSAGDFFPAIMQDNKRATILGTRTAGAGGYVIAAEFPNHFGLSSLTITGSLAERKNGKPIENLGVTPDIPYTMSINDLQDDYAEYAACIVTHIEELVGNQ